MSAAERKNPTVAVGLPAEVGGAADVFDCSTPHRRPEDAGDPLLAALLRAAWCLGRIEAALDSLADELRAIDVAELASDYAMLAREARHVDLG